MPYIHKDCRAAAQNYPATAGELTFAIQQLLKTFIAASGDTYRTYAEVMGALRGAELDLWDRKIRAYESAKCSENGDVW